MTFVVANMVAGLYLLQNAFGGGSRFIPDEEERLRDEAIFRFVRNAELTTIVLLALLSAYLLLTKPTSVKPLATSSPQ